LGEHRPPVLGADADRHRADPFLENDVGLVAGQRHLAEGGQHERGADGRVARKRQFNGRREDPQTAGVGGVVGGQNKDRFRQAKLGGDGLHQRRIDGAGIGKHGQRIAAEEAVGENVGGQESMVNRSLSRWV